MKDKSAPFQDWVASAIWYVGDWLIKQALRLKGNNPDEWHVTVVAAEEG